MSWPPLAIASWLSEDDQWSAVSGAGWLEWGSLAFTTLASSLIAHTALFYLIQRYPVSSVTPLTLLSPLFGIFFGVLLLDDQLTARMLLGGLITLAGVFIVSVRDRRIVDTGT